jgi:hypothetical protein
MSDIVERLREQIDPDHPNLWKVDKDRVEAADEIERLRAIMHLQNDEIKMLRGRLRADAPFDAVADYKQFRRDNPDTVTVDEMTVLRGVPPARDPKDEPWTVP